MTHARSVHEQRALALDRSRRELREVLGPSGGLEAALPPDMSNFKDNIDTGADKTKSATDTVADKAKNVVEKVGEKIKEGAEVIADKARIAADKAKVEADKLRKAGHDAGRKVGG
jgi:hypothetical protein